MRDRRHQTKDIGGQRIFDNVLSLLFIWTYFYSNLGISFLEYLGFFKTREVF
jgi:hypothetical protein